MCTSQNLQAKLYLFMFSSLIAHSLMSIESKINKIDNFSEYKITIVNTV